MFVDPVVGYRRAQEELQRFKNEVEGMKRMLRDERHLRVTEFNNKLWFQDRERMVETERGEKFLMRSNVLFR